MKVSHRQKSPVCAVGLHWGCWRFSLYHYSSLVNCNGLAEIGVQWDLCRLLEFFHSNLGQNYISIELASQRGIIISKHRIYNHATYDVLASSCLKVPRGNVCTPLKSNKNCFEDGQELCGASISISVHEVRTPRTCSASLNSKISSVGDFVADCHYPSSCCSALAKQTHIRFICSSDSWLNGQRERKRGYRGTTYIHTFLHVCQV